MFMSIQQIANNSASDLQKVSRTKIQAQKAEELKQTEQIKAVDEYIHEEPDKPAGIYDENGKLTESVQKTEKSDVEKENENENSTMTIKAGEGKGAGGGAPAGGVQRNAESTGSSDDDDSELEELELQRSKILQKLNAEKDENAKAQLRNELQTIESEIVQLKLA